jgi:uncharacterized membrane protein HdeD (DUF308 family)
MSDVQARPGPRGLGWAHVSLKWGWFVGFGVLLIVIGVFALGDVVAVTLASTVFIGAMLLIGGIVQIVHSFMTKESWGSFLLHLLGGALYVLGGLLIMDEPVRGSLVITLVLAISLVVGGALRAVIALRHREVAGWWLLLLGGLVSLVVGVLLFAQLPWSGLWVLGTLIGIELIFMGVVWLQFGLNLRRLGGRA